MAKKQKQGGDAIEALLEGAAQSHGYEATPEVVENRRLSVGDELQIGNLELCEVVGVSKDGRFVAVKHSAKDKRGNGDEEMEISAWPWTSCFKKINVGTTQFARKERLIPNYLNSDVSALISKVIQRGVVDNPNYQRGYVWSIEDKIKLIDSIFDERAIGSFVFVEMPYEVYKGKLEVLDGKQRLNAIVEFFCSKFQFKGKYFHELSRMDRIRFEGFSVQFAHVQGGRMKRRELLELFLMLNTGGVPQSDEHLEYVRGLLKQEVAKA